jgi:hypothetical protein
MVVYIYIHIYIHAHICNRCTSVCREQQARAKVCHNVVVAYAYIENACIRFAFA